METQRSREADGIVARIVEDIVRRLVVTALGVHPVDTSTPLAIACFEAGRSAESASVSVVADIRLTM